MSEALISTIPPTLTGRYGLPLAVRFCTRCVISNQRPNSCVEYAHTADSRKNTIAFDADGVCDACRVAEAKASVDWAERARELDALCAEHRRTDGAYDCVVPGSGGKDSFFAALELRRRGMHPLLVTWAPHLYTDIGRRNLEAWQALGDHYLVTPNRDTHRLLTRLAVENLFHPFQPFIVGQKGMAPKLAHRLGIKLVFYGEDEAEYGNPAANWKRAARDSGYFSAAPQNVYLSGVSLQELQERYGVDRAALQPYLPLEPEQAQAVDVRYLGYYLPWHPQGAFYAATENGFEVAPERTPGTYSKYNSLDDKLDDLHYWTTFQKFGIGRATYDAAQEIRSGDITRSEGVSLVRRYDGEYPQRYESEVLRYLTVPGFVQATQGWLAGLAEKFRPAHLWDGDRLRHQVA